MKLRALRVVAVLALVLVGCSSRKEDAPRPAAESTVARASAPTTPAQAAGGVTAATGPSVPATKDASHVARSLEVGVATASPLAITATTTTCPQVALQTTAMGNDRGFDETSTSSAVSFQVPGTLTVTSGNARDFVALFEYGPTSSEAGETECLYLPKGATELRLVECHVRARHGQPRPGAGATVSGTHFELHVDAIVPICHDTVTVRVELGSVAASDNNPCTADSCGTHGGVVHTPSSAGASCSNGNACAGAGTCNASGACVTGAPPVVDDGNPCTADACDPITGVTHTPVAAGTQCGTANACTQAATCNATGTCVAGAPVSVDDGNPCTSDACSASTGVTHTPVAPGTQCGTGDACTTAPSCNASAICVSGSPVPVDDGNPCTADSCTLATGVTHTPVAVGTVCAAGNACTSASSCSAAGTCVAGTPVPVDDGNPCTADSCSVATGVTHTPVAAGTVCAAGNACTAASSCNASASCVPGSPVPVDDGKPCTADSCSLSSGVTHTPLADGSQCGPGNVCTGVSTCSAGTCMVGTPAVVDDGSPCTVDACSPATGVTHTPVATGTSCSDGNACNGAETCSASGTCVPGAPPVIDTSNACLVGSCDPATGVTYHHAAVGTSCGGDVCAGVSTCTATGACQAGTPPSLNDGDACTKDACSLPAGVTHTAIPGCGVPLVAPPLDTTVSYDFTTATSFLFTAANPVQVGVAAGAIDPSRQAVFRGRVLDVNGAPLRGVQISVRGHGELGVSYTRDDGAFDFAANGGMSLVLEMLGEGFIPVSRLVSATNHDYVTLADVVLTKRDTAVATVDMDSGSYQAFSATPRTDADGTRTATLLIPPGTTSDLAGVNTLHVRATEVTVGPMGKNAMPGLLPPTSGYTYAVDFAVDEADALGVERVNFSQPLSLYVDNFLNMPVGGAVPTGAYDRGSGTWVPVPNGVVLTILSTTGGVAHLDVTGDGVEDSGAALSAFGITPQEQAQLAVTYAGASGKSLWRAQIKHFTTYDTNWPVGAGGGGGCSGKCDDPPKDPPPPCPQAAASTIDCTSQILGEDWSVAGSPFSLHYQSDRTLGYLPTVDLSLGGPPFSPTLLRVDVTVNIAGVSRTFPVAVADIPKGLHFVWDRKDAYGRDVPGTQVAEVTIGYVYKAVYLKPGEKFGDAPGAQELSGSRSRGEVYLQDFKLVPLGGVVPHPGLGGVTLSAHHFLDTFSGTLYYGDGRRSNFAQTLHVADVAGSAGGSTSGSHVPVSAANIQAQGGAFGPDGLFYYVDQGQVRVLKDGFVEAVVGRGGIFDDGDGGPAINAGIVAQHIAFGPDGTLYVADSRHLKVRQVKNGIITAFAGNGAPSNSGTAGDGGPAVDASFYTGGAIAAIRADRAGYVYVVASVPGEFSPYNVRRVGPDGIISGFAGYGAGTPGSALAAGPIRQVDDLAIGPDGSVYIAESSTSSVLKVDPQGMLAVVAGGNGSGTTGNGGPATLALLSSPQGITVDRTGNLYILDAVNVPGYPFTISAIRVVDSQGIITALSGGDRAAANCAPDTSLSLAHWHFSDTIAVAPDDTLYVPDLTCGTIRRISSIGASGVTRTIADGSGQVHTFDVVGRHLSTRDQRTGGPVYTFEYDGNGLLGGIVDGDGKRTTIHRSGGQATDITAPFGQVTTLSYDASGFLASIRNPNGELENLSFGPTGLLTNLLDARGYTHAYGFTPEGLLTSDQDGAGATQTLVSTFDPRGRSVVRTSAEGRASGYSYQVDDLGREVSTRTSPSGATSTVSVDPVNASSVATAADGTVTTSTSSPDPIYGMISPQSATTEVTPSGLTRYTSVSRRATLTNPSDPFSIASEVLTTITNPGDCALGSACAGLLTWTQSYDAGTRQLVSTSPLGRTTTTVLDARGRPVQYATPGVTPTTLHYDAAGRVDQVAQGVRVSSTAFNPATGWASAFTDALGRTTTIDARDGVGRVLSTTLPGARTVQQTFDAAGNMTSLTPPGENATTLSYTPVDLEAAFTPPPVPGASGQVQTFYNLDRQKTEERRSEGSIFFGYDAFGRAATETSPTLGLTFGYNGADQLASLGSNDVSLAYTYDGSLLRTVAFSGAVAGVVERRYDNLWRVSQVLANAESTAMSYDNDGLLLQTGPVAFSRDTQNGRVTGSTANHVLDTRGYDSFGAVNHYDARDSAGSLLSLDYVRENGGRITQITESLLGGPSVVTSYGYDAAGRLASVTRGAKAVTYGFDPNGNRTQVSGVNVATYDAQDRMLTYGANTYEYTAGGNLSVKSSPAGNTQYTYDLYGSLRSATLPDGAVLDYLVDGTHRRVGKKRNGVLEQGWLYDGQLRAIAELDGANNLVSIFMYGEKSNVPEAMTKGGNTYRVVTDHLGSVRLVVDVTTGAIAQALEYDAWGNVTSDSSPGFQPFGFAGGLYDRDLALVRFGARDYDPEAGRWTTRDPIRFYGAQTNLYVYVEGEPLNASDPGGKADPYRDPSDPRTPLPWPVQLCRYVPQGSPARAACCATTCGREYGKWGVDYSSCVERCDPPLPKPPPICPAD